MGDRPTFLDMKNAGLLAGAVVLPLLVGIASMGPLRASVRNLDRERVEHLAKMEKIGERVKSLEPIGLKDRTRWNEVFERLRVETVSTGKNADPEIVREAARLLEGGGVNQIHVIVEKKARASESEPRETLPVARLDGADRFTLVPHRVRLQGRGSFSKLRNALDRLGDPTVPVQVDAVSLLREGPVIRAEIELVYWSREEAP